MWPSVLKEQNQFCQWLVKWSAALVRLLSRNRQARWQIRGLWYSLFHTLGCQNFSASSPQNFHALYGWPNSEPLSMGALETSFSSRFFCKSSIFLLRSSFYRLKSLPDSVVSVIQSRKFISPLKELFEIAKSKINDCLNNVKQGKLEIVWICCRLCSVWSIFDAIYVV